MINPFRDINWQPGSEQLRAFARSLLIGFPLLAAIFAVSERWWSSSWPSWPLWLAGCGMIAGGLCWVSVRIARPFYLIWHALSGAMGLIVSNTILALIFYLILTPIGLLLRLVGRDALQRKWDPTANTYWITTQPSADTRDYFRQS